MVLERLRLRRHEEPRVPPDLPQLRVSQTVFDDGVDEAQGHRVVFHLGLVQVVEQERRALFNYNGVVSAVKWRLGLKGDLGVEVRGRKQVVPHEDVL